MPGTINTNTFHVEKSPRSQRFASLVSAPNVLPNLKRNKYINIKEIRIE